MHNNDALRRLRYALDIDDEGLLELFDSGGIRATSEQLSGWLVPDGEPGWLDCQDDTFEAFLDALILKKRGPPPPNQAPRPATALTNNAILKKLRVALSLQERDLIEILRVGGHQVSKGELGGLLRVPGHKHYRECGDQLMRAFLRGLTQKLRGRSGSTTPRARD